MIATGGFLSSHFLSLENKSEKQMGKFVTFVMRENYFVFGEWTIWFWGFVLINNTLVFIIFGILLDFLKLSFFFLRKYFS